MENCVYFAVDRHLKANGKTVEGMGQVQKREGDGFIVVNGQVDQKVDMAFGRALHLPQNMREHGPAVYKMATVLKLMPMEVNIIKYHM